MDNCYINEDLIIKDMSELELDMEYYVKFYDADFISYDGLYTVVNIKSLNNVLGKSCVIINIDTCNNIELVLKNNVWIFNTNLAGLADDLRIDEKLRNNGLFINRSFNIHTVCDIYKLPPTEYVLK
jgi:hypothetical protein